MDSWIVVGAIIAALALSVLLYLNIDKLVAHRLGRLLLLFGVVIVPVALSGAGVGVGVVQSSKTTFCLSCHEMQTYGKSLFVDDSHALAAVHFQNRTVNRDFSCYVCHKDYAMFGDVSAKLNGLRHVWVHYVGGPPEKIQLYKPYSNNNCLHCHDDARSYLDVPMHVEHARALDTGQRSCLECHDMAHNMESVQAGTFWQAERP